MQPFRPRPVRFHGLRHSAGWRLKLYSITHHGAAPRLAELEGGIAAALGELPQPAAAAGRPGAGFVVAHEGRSADYVVLGWWDRDNELPVRVWIRPEGGGWRPAEGGESFCVWDLQVLWFEREAYVATVLAEGEADPVRAYLARHLAVEPAAVPA
jgi:hypothetical protein